jgi:hypothetical protein
MRRRAMKPSFTFAIWLVACACDPCIAAGSAPAQLKIDSIRAMPYYVDRGIIRTSTDLFDPRLVLRNVVVPPGSAGDPLHRSRIDDWDIVFGTTATFVAVTIAGADLEQLADKIQVSFSATAVTSGRKLAAQDVMLAPLIVKGSRQTHVPFLVYGTGCEAVELKVHLHDGKAVISHLERTIPFSCGE